MQHSPLGQTGLSGIRDRFRGVGDRRWGGSVPRRTSRSAPCTGDRTRRELHRHRPGLRGERELVGEVVREHRDEGLFVATKVPPKNRMWPAPAGVTRPTRSPATTSGPASRRACTSPAWRRSTSSSSTSGAMSGWAGATGWRPSRPSSEEGNLRYFGISVNDYQPENALELVRAATSTRPGHLQRVPPGAGGAAAPRLPEHGVGVIVRVALDEGGLTGRITKDITSRRGLPRHVLRGGRRPRSSSGGGRWPTTSASPGQVPDVALRYVLTGSRLDRDRRHADGPERGAERRGGRRPGTVRPQQTVEARHRWERNLYQSWSRSAGQPDSRVPAPTAGVGPPVLVATPFGR